MNISLMKYADEYIGRILCALLGRSKSRQAGFPEAAGNILFIKFWGMGSIILTSPAVQAVHDKFPQAKLHYLTFESNREVLEILGIADSIITIMLIHYSQSCYYLTYRIGAVGGCSIIARFSVCVCDNPIVDSILLVTLNTTIILARVQVNISDSWSRTHIIIIVITAHCC